MKLISVLIILLVATTSCIATKSTNTADDVFLNTSVAVDGYRKTTWIKGPLFRSSYNITNTIFLRCLVQEENVSFYQLYISDKKQDWRFYNSAYDLKGKKLNFVQIDHEVTSGAMTKEDFAISLTKDYLTENTQTGLNIKIYGKRGDVVLSLPPHYIQGFLRKVEAYTTRPKLVVPEGTDLGSEVLVLGARKPTLFTHRSHQNKNIGCETCHSEEITHLLATDRKNTAHKLCVTCHREKGVSVKCNFCHSN